MFWTAEERQSFWERNQVSFAERAYDFPCVDIPTILKCVLCDIHPSECKNKKEIDKMNRGVKKADASTEKGNP